MIFVEFKVIQIIVVKKTLDTIWYLVIVNYTQSEFTSFMIFSANTIDRQLNIPGSITGLEKPLIPGLPRPSSHKSRKKDAYIHIF